MECQKDQNIQFIIIIIIIILAFFYKCQKIKHNIKFNIQFYYIN